MRLRAPRTLVALAPVLLLAACQDPDVGNPCTIDWGQDAANPPPTSVGLSDPTKYPTGGPDYFESGNIACEGLVCIISPAASGEYASIEPARGYCSKPCVSNDDCYEDETGLVCRQMVLDPVFLDQLDPATRARYLPVQYSSYCALQR
jgi:hypothetical protein